MTPEQENQRKAYFATIVTAVLRATNEYRDGGPENAATVADASVTVDALAFAQALILEFHPMLKTDADIQGVVERVAGELYRLITVMRKSTEETGTHPITDFGVASPMPHGPN